MHTKNKKLKPKKKKQVPLRPQPIAQPGKYFLIH